MRSERTRCNGHAALHASYRARCGGEGGWLGGTGSVDGSAGGLDVGEVPDGCA